MSQKLTCGTPTLIVGLTNIDSKYRSVTVIVNTVIVNKIILLAKTLLTRKNITGFSEHFSGQKISFPGSRKLVREF